MKSSFKYILLLGFLTFFSSCDDFLDRPGTSIITDLEFWETPAQARQGVAAIYDRAQISYQTNIRLYGEYRADNFMPNDRPDANQVQILNNDIGSNTSGTNWGGWYTSIATANIAINRIEDMPSFDGKNDLLAQAYSLRALFYFWVVRIWGDVPLITEPIENIDQAIKLERNPANEVFDLILEDLARAEQLIDTQRDRDFVSLGMILALKAHIYMWPGDHQDYSVSRNAIVQLEDLGYRLETTQDGWINNLFRTNNPTSDEVIFKLAWNFDEDGANGGYYSLTSLAPIWLVSEDIREKWTQALDEDWRRVASFEEDLEDREIILDWMIYHKWSGEHPDLITRNVWNTTQDYDIILFRFADLLLLKAEAENNLENPSAALALINRIRTARDLPLVDETISDPTTIRDMILDERRWELAAEGHRFWDLVRNGVVLEVMEPINGWDDERTVFWPVHDDVITRNPNITQTPGY